MSDREKQLIIEYIFANESHDWKKARELFEQIKRIDDEKTN